MAVKNNKPTALLACVMALSIGVLTATMSQAAALTNNSGNSSASSTSGTNDMTTSTGKAGTKKTTTTATCTVDPKHKKLQDLYSNEKPVPWKRNGAKQVVIYFESSKVTSRYKTAMVKAAKTWSRSSCVELKVVSKCPVKVRCVPATLKTNSPKPNTVGMFFGMYQDGYLISGRLEFYTKRLASVTDRQITNVAIHEMGHALGLTHRKAKGTLMSKVSGPNLINPSAVELQNLRVLYGSQK